MAVENVYFRNAGNNGQFETSAQEQNRGVVTNPIVPTEALLIPAQAAMAMRAYALSSAPVTPVIKNNPDLNTLKQTLLKRGFVEGRDFEICRGDDSCTLEIYKNDKKIGRYLWNNSVGDKKSYEGHFKIYNFASDDCERIETFFDKDDKPIYRSHTYPKSPFKNDPINCKTTPDDYIKYLDANNIKYAVDRDDGCINISSSNPVTENMVKVSFICNEQTNEPLYTVKELYGSDNNVEKRIEYNHEQTVDVVEYIEKKHAYHGLEKV